METPQNKETNQQPNPKFNLFINSVIGIFGCYVGSSGLMLIGFGLKELPFSIIFDWFSEILIWVFGFVFQFGSFLIFPFSILVFVITIVRIGKCNVKKSDKFKTNVALGLNFTAFVVSLVFLLYTFT